MKFLQNKFFITIDVEPDCDIHWNRSNPLTFESILCGISKILRPIWDKYSIKPIYFVSPEVVMNKECCRILKEEINKGAIIGAHLHSEYIKPKVTIKNFTRKPSEEFPCYAHSTKIEYEKIKNLTSLIKKELGIKPIWYRAARYGADLNTIKSLARLDYKYDSSITPGINWADQKGPNHTNAPKQPYYISKNNYYKKAPNQKESMGVIEVPITISGKRFGLLGKFLPDKWLFYKWLRPSHMTLIELKSLIRVFKNKYNKPTLTMMFHSMEIIPNKSPFVRNKLMQKIFLDKIESCIKLVKK